MTLAKQIIEFIVALLLKLYNNVEQKRLDKEIKKNKEDLNAILEKSHIEYNQLMDDYDDYLRTRDKKSEKL